VQSKNQDRQTVRPPDRKNSRPSDLQTFRLSDLQTFRPSDFQTFRLSDFQTFRLSDLQTPFTGIFPHLIRVKYFFTRKNYENSKSFLNIAAEFPEDSEPDGRI
jgi:hypothetical protein